MWRRRAPGPEPLDDPWSEVLTVLFPAGLDETQMAKVRAAVGALLPTASSARVALGVLDQQTSNSPVTIRWGVDDLAYADVAGVRLALDRADASVSIQITEGAYEPHVEATLDRLLAPVTSSSMSAPMSATTRCERRDRWALTAGSSRSRRIPRTPG